MKDWTVILSKHNDSILNVLEKINSTGYRFVIVIDENEKLLGTVTDGDVRRGLISGVQLQDNISKVMNTKPLVLPINSSKKEIHQLMIDKEIQHLPLVDKNLIIKNVVSLKDLLVVEQKENTVVLMAGGLGSRLASLTADCPKSMLKIGGTPILETTIETLKEHGFYKFAISVNYKAEMIEEYFQDGSRLNVKIDYIKEKNRLGTAGALSLFNTHNELPFIVMNGDLLTKLNFSHLIDFHQDRKNKATMCLRQYEHQIPFGVVTVEGENVLNIEEKPIRSYFVNGGIYVLNPEILSRIPADVYYDMPTFYESLIEENLKVGAYPFFDYWIDIGRIDDYERANLEFLEIFK